MKTIYDLHKNNIKIIVSGSESLFLRKKPVKPLAGRIYEFKVETLSFREFLDFKNKNWSRRPVRKTAKTG